tara:strand:- start:211 stop:411 length:201 start_codon:yes stop_codon:yes gene_type:complete
MEIEIVSREEFNEFKAKFSKKLDNITIRLDSHIDNQEKRNRQILALLNSPDYIELKQKLSKYKEQV